MLGWKITDDGKYKSKMSRMSREEEEIIALAEAEYARISKERKIASGEDAKGIIGRILAGLGEQKGIYMDEDQLGYLAEAAAKHIYGFGPLEDLSEDPSIEEISVIGVGNPVYVYLRGKGWVKTNIIFTDREAIIEVINKMAKSIGRRITLQNPRIDAVLPNGSRMHASIPPVSSGEITIRKFSQKPFSPKEIIENGAASIDLMVFCSFLMQSDSSVLIAGNTASGKTTTMNALFSFVPSNERVIIIEETPEINIPHKHQLRLVSNREMGISLSDLVYDSLRMRPDRTIIGEIRNREEAEALFEILLSGQARGSYATMHGKSLNECLQRLRSMGVNPADLNSIDAVIVQRRMLVYDRKARRNREVRLVTEAGSPEETVFSLRDGKLGYRKENKAKERVMEKLGLSGKEFMEEWAERAGAIRKCDGEFWKFYGRIQKAFYGLKEDV